MILAMAMSEAVASEVPALTTPLPQRSVRIRRGAQGLFVVGAGVAAAGALSFPVTAWAATGWRRFIGLSAIPLGIPLMSLGSLEDRRALRLAGGDAGRTWGTLGLAFWGAGMGLAGVGVGGFVLAPETPEGRYYALSAVMLTFSTLAPMFLLASAAAAGAQMDQNERGWGSIEGGASSMRSVVTVRVEPQFWEGGGGLAISGTW